MINIITDGCKLTAVSLAGAFYIHDDVKEILPCTLAIHQAALKASDEFNARATLSLLYFTKPVDRLIQTLATPIFYQMNYFKGIADWYHCDSYLLKSFAVIGALAVPIAVPVLLLMGTMHALCPLINGLYQVIVPYQTLYAVAKGKEASREFFDYYNTISKNKIVASPPAQTLNDIVTTYPLQPGEGTLYTIARIIDEVSGGIACTLALFLSNPLPIVMPTARILSAC